MISIIVACSRNWVIGINNSLPWRLPEDLRHFKNVTMGKPMIMGRKTFDSIGRALPGRTTLVVTRQQDWRRQGVRVCATIDDALAQARLCLIPGQSEVMIVGGEQIYRQCLPQVKRIYLTRVEIDADGDAFFPELDQSQWRQLAREEGYSESAGLNYSFITLERD
jgi:dihydrofolate reductase